MTQRLPSLRRRLRGLVRRGVARARSSSHVRRLLRPTVSVVVPIYNVEQYLAECLDSILEQGFTDFEVVVVDDGSPDGSRAIAEAYAARDPRVRVVARTNGGLGAARNTGVRHARGRYLTFVDSDDMLAAGALAALVGSARRSGSDIVVGSVRRFDTEREWRPEWVSRVQAQRRTAITLADFPALLRNLYTWNKLFRSDFFTAQGLQFREGVAYEDQPVITQLYHRARSIDVIPEVVYKYRQRDDRSSISQQTATLPDLRARLEAFDLTRRALLEEAPREIYLAWLQTLFDSHLHWYLMSPGIVDDTYWAELRAAVLGLTEAAPQEIWDRTPPLRRVMLQLARLDRRADVQELVGRTEKELDDWKSTVRPDGVLVHLPLLGDPDLDDSLFLLRPEQLRVAQSIEHLGWTTDAGGSLVCSLQGWAFVKKVDLASADQRVSVVVRAQPGGEEHVYAATGRPAPSYPPPAEDSWCDYSPGTFAADVPLGAIAGRPASDWELFVRVETCGFTVTAPFTRLIRMGSAGAVPAARLPGGERVAVEWRLFEPVRLHRLPAAAEVTDVAVVGRTVSGRLVGPRAGEVARVVVTSGRATSTARVRDDRFSVLLPDRPDRAAGRADGRRRRDSVVSWHLVGRQVDESGVALLVEQDLDVVGDVPEDSLLQAHADRLGELTVSEWLAGAVAETVELTDDDRLVVGGRAMALEPESVALVGRHKKILATGAEVPVVGGRFKAELALAHPVYRFGSHPLPVGDHDLRVLLRRGSGTSIEVPLQIAPSLSATLPIPVATDRHEGRVVRGSDGALRLAFVRPLGESASRYQQRLLRASPPRRSGLTRGVLFRSYFGELATDNGVSIQAELRQRGSDLPVYWAVQDHSVVVPDGGIPVVVNTPEWYALVSSVAYYVDNMYQPDYLRKRSGQVLVQTFHGYPFKQMGHPHWRNLGFPAARIASYDARAKDWDYLVSPARYATPLLTRYFAYDGEVLEIGYPRNDVLLSPQADAIRAATRECLGVAEHQTAVLYAPTFRDYLSADDMRADMVDFFDFETARRALGDDVVLLVRGHAFNARRTTRVSAEGTVEVTDYPEVADLYLASDAAVVDYSSLRFDYGVTGKPMIFHVPDLQRYQETRGWLMDFGPTAPGPHLNTTDEVVAALLDLDGVRARHAEDYAAFRASYLDLEDGHAGRRFVDAVFVPRGDA